MREFAERNQPLVIGRQPKSEQTYQLMQLLERRAYRPVLLDDELDGSWLINRMRGEPENRSFLRGYRNTGREQYARLLDKVQLVPGGVVE